MILIDRTPLELDALNDPKHKLHDFAVLYDDTIKSMNATFKNGFIRFKRMGYPKFVEGADSNFRKVPKLAEPTPPMRIPLRANVPIGKLGKHMWMCCLDAPEVLPNGLWDMPKFGSNKSLSVKEDILVNINEQPDLAFFLYKISPFVTKGLIQVVDTKKDDEQLGEAERMLTERKYAVWNMLSDVDKLKRMARAYGVNNVDTKEPNAVRKELEATLLANDDLKRSNPAVKGTKEFIEEMKVTDGVLLRNFIQLAVDESKLAYKPDGRWKIGDKNIIQVPQSEISRPKDYLCNYLMTGNNVDKLQEFLKDLLNKEYLENITDKKEWVWLAKIADISTEFVKIEKIKASVTEFYCPV